MSFLPAILAPFLALASLFTTSPYTRIVNRVESSVVRITGERDMGLFGPQFYVCSGVVIAQHRILTAAHCVGDSMKVDERGPATVLKVDVYYDLALLQLTTDKPSLVFRDTPVVRFESLTATGYAFGLSKPITVTVQALLVDVPPIPELPPGLLTTPGYIGGMSGGPVADGRGEMVGIVQQSNSGVGYGVGILIIRSFLLGTN